MHPLINKYEPRPLLVPVPPMLEAALGYFGDSRFVGFYWEPAGDEFRIAEGRIAYDGSHHAYLRFVRHPRVAPALAGLDLGGSEERATQWLILDREDRKLYVLPADLGAKLVADQHGFVPDPDAPPEAPIEMTHEEMMDEARAMFTRMSMVRIAPEDRGVINPFDLMTSERLREEALAQWLDG